MRACATPEEVFEVGINRAVSLLAEKAANRRPQGASVIKDLGDHPEGGGKVQVLSGRYGPYVKHGKVNATLPRDRVPKEVTMDEAVDADHRACRQGACQEEAGQGRRQEDREG